MIGDSQVDDDNRSPRGDRQLMGAMAMTKLRRVWGIQYLIITMMVTVPGVLVLLQWRGDSTDRATTPVLPTAGQPVVAPDFSLRDLEGNVRRLASFRGRVVLLSFWATWCPPCRTDIPFMESLYQAYKDRGFEVVTVASDVEGANVVQPFVTRFHLSFTTLLDTTAQVTRLYGVTSLPTTYLLDREGRLVTVVLGSHNWEKADTHALIRSLLDSAQQTPVPHGSEMVPARSSARGQKIAGGP